jgi:molybdate transport system substrate-binding protein
MQGVFDSLAPEFTKATGYGTDLVFAPPLPAAKRIIDGEAADIVISTPEAIDGLIREGKVAGGSSRVVACMIMGLAVGMNEPKPDISTPAEFKQALLPQNRSSMRTRIPAARARPTSSSWLRGLA